MISSKLEKLINLASSDNPNEAEQSSKMAVSLMIREGVAFDELLASSSRLYLEGLVSVAKSYSYRTTKTNQESQKLFSELLLRITNTYNTSDKEPEKTTTEGQSRYEEELSHREYILKEKEERLRKKEEKISQHYTEANIPEPKAKSREWWLNSINNDFLHKCITRPFRTIQLFFVSLAYGIFHSFLINLGIFIGIIFFGLEFTYNPSFISFFFIVAFPFMVWKSIKLYGSWY